MTFTTETLRGELERLFELDELKTLSADLLGLDPDQLGGAEAKAPFARALVERCSEDGALLALVDAVLVSKKDVDAKIGEFLEVPAVAPLEPGTRVGSFQVVRQLGEGPVGTVYLAESSAPDPETRQVALKVLHPLHAEARGAVRRFQTAARMQRGLASPHLARVLEVGALEDGRPYVATEFVEGTSLAERIARRGAMHYNEARPVIRGVLSALETLHARGLAHGDVKAENVFVVPPNATGRMTNEPTGVLMDAGTDRLFARDFRSTEQACLLSIPSSPKAIAPEVARGAPADVRSDLYAVGCLLYEVLTGRPPFVGATAIDVLAHHLLTPPEPPSNHAPRGWVGSDLDAIVLSMLAKEASARPPTARALRETLEAIGRASIPPEARRPEALDEAAFETAAARLEAEPDDDAHAIEVERIAGAAQAWVRAIEVLKKAADAAASPKAQSALHYRIARIAETEHLDHDTAATSYRAILALDPDDDLARAALEDLKRRTGDAEGLVELLVESAERKEDPSERAAILRELGEAYETLLQDSESAYVSWVQALTEDPRDERTFAEVSRLAGHDLDRWNEAVTALSEALEGSSDEQHRVGLLLVLGHVYGDRLRRPDFAQPCFVQALATDPGNERALDALITLYRNAQSWHELVATLLARAQVTANPARARDGRAAAAEILRNKIGDRARAIELLERIAGEDAAHPEATTALASYYAEREQWSALATLLDRKAGSQHGGERAATLCALAELYEDRLGDPEQAVARYEAALRYEDRSVAALKGLERMYARLGRFRELLGTLEAQLEVAVTPRQKIALLDRMGQMHLEEFVDHQRAAECFERILAIEPDHESAHTALSRAYRHLRQWENLAGALERHASAVEDEERKLALLLAAAKVLLHEVGAPERALSLGARITALRPNHAEALELVALVQAQSGDADQALSATLRLAEAEKEPARRAELLVQAGRILEDRGDKDGAIDWYKQAIDAHPQEIRAFAALRSIYASRGDVRGIADLLGREIEATRGNVQKAKLYAELGELARNDLDDRARARDAFAKALEHDATCTSAALGLGDLAFEDGDWTLAIQHFEPLLARDGEVPAERTRDVLLRCGDAHRARGELEKALGVYAKAETLFPSDREVHERAAETTLESGNAARAVERYRDLLARLGDELLGRDKGRILHRLGESLRQIGDAEAEGILNEAAALLPGDGAPLVSLERWYASREAHADVVATLRRRLAAARDEERFDILVTIGDVLAQKLGDRAAAAQSYVAALEMRGDDRGLLTKLMAIYSDDKDWTGVVEVVLRLAAQVDDPSQRAKYHHTAAAISHHELAKLEDAAEHYEQALEHDPDMPKSFSGLVATLEALGNWERLEKAVLKRLERLDPNVSAEERASLWDRLGEVRLYRLRNANAAVEAFEEARRLDPRNRRRAERLAELYAAEPKRFFSKALKVHRDLLSLNPYRIESYQELRKLYSEAKRSDRIWCVCQALTVLKSAAPDEEDFFARYRRMEPAAASQVIGPALWAEHLIHPEQDSLVTEIFAVIEPAVLATQSQPLASMSTRAKRVVDPAKASIDMARVLHYAAGVLGLALPEVYASKDDPSGLGFLFSNPPAVCIGRGALGSSPMQALAFVAGRHLSYLKPGHLLRMLAPTGGGLRTWLLAAVHASVGGLPASDTQPALVAERIAVLKAHLPVPQMERLRSLVQRLLGVAPELDMLRWMRAVDLTADRVGFLLANDLELATAIVRATPEGSSEASKNERLKGLHLYAVSDEYFGLRQKLGIAIDS